MQSGKSRTAGWTAFFLVIAVVELVWLVSEYENNVYMRQYLEQRPVLLYGSIFGSLAAASVFAVVVARIVSASPTSRTARVAKTLQA